jgi:hypothetical protein
MSMLRMHSTSTSPTPHPDVVRVSRERRDDGIMLHIILYEGREGTHPWCTQDHTARVQHQHRRLGRFISSFRPSSRYTVITLIHPVTRSVYIRVYDHSKCLQQAVSLLTCVVAYILSLDPISLPPVSPPKPSFPSSSFLLPLTTIHTTLLVTLA